MEKKNIAFVELETHSALVEQWYFLVNEMKLIDFHFFVSQKVFEKITTIPKDKISVITSVSNTNFTKYSLIVINTLHRNFKDYSKIFKDKPVLTLIHNLNFSYFFKYISVQNILKEKNYFLYFLKLYLFENVLKNRKIIKQSSLFGVLSQSVFNYAESQNNAKNNFQLIELSFVKNATFLINDYIQVVIPGNVSSKRKDIDLVFESA